jgi:hypothetical protein
VAHVAWLCNGSGGSGRAERVAQVRAVFALAVGFAVAGLIASVYELVMCRPASFRLLQRSPDRSRFAAVPMLIFAAPFIIMRNTIRARRIVGRRFTFVMLSTILAGFWSLMSGTVVVMLIQRVGHLLG